MGAASSVRASGLWASVVPNRATGTVTGIATLQKSVSLVWTSGLYLQDPRKNPGPLGSILEVLTAVDSGIAIFVTFCCDIVEENLPPSL